MQRLEGRERGEIVDGRRWASGRALDKPWAASLREALFVVVWDGICALRVLGEGLLGEGLLGEGLRIPIALVVRRLVTAATMAVPGSVSMVVAWAVAMSLLASLASAFYLPGVAPLDLAQVRDGNGVGVWSAWQWREDMAIIVLLFLV